MTLVLHLTPAIPTYVSCNNCANRVQITDEIIASIMIEAIFVSSLLFMLTLLLLSYHKWENSAYVKMIDLIPGPKRKFIVGNVTDLPYNSVGKITNVFIFFHTAVD